MRITHKKIPRIAPRRDIFGRERALTLESASSGLDLFEQQGLCRICDNLAILRAHLRHFAAWTAASDDQTGSHVERLIRPYLSYASWD